MIKKDKTITKAITTIVIRLCWPILIIKALEYSNYIPITSTSEIYAILFSFMITQEIVLCMLNLIIEDKQ